MGGDNEKEEIIVKAPSKPVVSTDKKVERARERLLEEERFDVIHVSSEVGVSFGASTAIVGILLLCIFAYVIITGEAGLIILSSDYMGFSLGLWVFVGLLNIISGFLLLGSED